MTFMVIVQNGLVQDSYLGKVCLLEYFYNPRW